MHSVYNTSINIINTAIDLSTLRYKIYLSQKAFQTAVLTNLASVEAVVDEWTVHAQTPFHAGHPVF